MDCQCLDAELSDFRPKKSKKIDFLNDAPKSQKVNLLKFTSLFRNHT